MTNLFKSAYLQTGVQAALPYPKCSFDFFVK